MYKKYFDILGISPTNDQGAIKRAYRKKAMIYHPDRNKDKNTHEKFVLISKAYELLSNTHNPKDHIYKSVSSKPVSSRPQKSPEDLMKERVKRAQEILKKQQEKEELEAEKYYQNLISGKHWRMFKIILYSSILLLGLLVIDFYVLNPNKINDTIISYNPDQSINNFEQKKVTPIYTALGHKMWIDKDYAYYIHNNPKIQIYQSPIFKVNLNIDILYLRNMAFANTYFNLKQSFTPMLLLLFIPIITLFIKAKTFTFSILFHTSMYVVSFANVFLYIILLYSIILE